MTAARLNATPRGGDVLREQIRIVGLILRREALVVLIVMAIGTIVIGFNIARGTAETWFDSDAWWELGFFGFLLPFAVWRRDKRFGPAFLWTLPVDRRRLALTRVFAGWVWVMVAVAVFISWTVVLALLSGLPDPETVSPFAFIGVTAAYLLGSAVQLGLRHPLRWLLGIAGVSVVLGFFNRAVDVYMSRGIVNALLNDAGSSWLSLSPAAQFVAAALFWLAAGLLALWIAVSRHAEQRRR